MTVIAAVAEGERVWMAADSATQLQDNILHNAAVKIRTMRVEDCDRQAVIGVCGSGAFNRFAHETLPVVGDDINEWAHACSDQLTAWAAERQLMADGDLDGSLLLGFRGRLWYVIKSQAGPIPRGYAAVGSGGDVALGVLAAYELNGGVAPEQQVRDAVILACRFDPWCYEPITVLDV